MPSVSIAIKNVFYRGILPLFLVAACVIRPSVVSLIYGILALICPLLPGITQASGVPGSTKAYLGLSLILCFVFALGQLAFQILIATTKPYGHTLPACNSTEVILRQFGFQKLAEKDYGNDVRVVLPELLSAVGSALAFFVCVVSKTPEQTLGFDPIPEEGTSSAGRRSLDVNGADKRTPHETTKPVPKRSWKDRVLEGIRRASDIAAVVLLCLVGTVWPGLLSVFYFLLFLTLIIWWSVYKRVRRPWFNKIKMLLLCYSGAHLVLLYLYQFPFFQTHLAAESFTARLVGLTAIVQSSVCTEDIWSLKFGVEQWSFFAHPVLLLLFYFYLAYQLRATYHGMQRPSDSDLDPLVAADDVSSVHEELAGPDSEDEATRKRPSKPRKQFSIGVVPLNPRTQTKYPRITKIVAFLVRNSFALSLLSMMIWAILFHTWLEFVWLILACLIWILPDSQRICFRFSPVIVFYACALLVIQYVYSLNLKHDLKDNEMKEWGQIGLSHYRWAYAYCIALWIKIVLCIPFFVTMRLFLRERFYSKLSPEEAIIRGNYGTFAAAGGEEVGGSTESLIEGTWLERFLGKYWIYLVALVLLLISVRNPVVMYNAGYMIFFVLLVIFLQVSAQFFVKTLFFYWTLLVVYSSVVLLWIYLYQFQGVPKWWKQRTNLSEEWNKDLGLESYTPGTLLVKLLTPISFLVVVILQLKFYHRVFRRITDIERVEGTGDGTTYSEGMTWKEWGCYWFDWSVNLLWRVTEIHARKIVAFALFILAISEVSLVNLVVVVLVVLMVSCRMVYGLLCVLTSVFLAAIVLGKMLFQMHFVEENVAQNAILPDGCASLGNGSNDSVIGLAEWAGFQKVDNIGNYLAGYILVLVLLGARAIVFYRQKFHRTMVGEQTPARGVIFPDVKRADADDSIRNCLKFFANYFFYKFGVEMCFITTVVVAAVRMDAVACVYVLWVLVLFAVSRRVKARIWWIYVVFLSVLLPLEYASCVGLPPSSCIEYPWQEWNHHLKFWLFLSDYSYKPDHWFLVADFFQLLFAVCQMFVFSVETGSAGEEHEGGDNREIISNRILPEDPHPRNPVKDYITESSSLLDVVKGVFFPYVHWVTLIIIFVAGLGAVSMFALGYLIAAFVFLWKGNETYLKPMGKVIRLWKVVAFYNILVILLKTGLQVVACAYYHDLTVSKSYCWVVQLFSIACVRQQVSGGANENCNVEKTEADIQFDVLCFVFLLFQLRVFGSWYFKHVVTEFQAERILSSRGAVLVNQLIVKEMKQQNYHEERRLTLIKNRTRRIREKYEKHLGEKKSEPQTYGQASRFFEEDSLLESTTSPSSNSSESSKYYTPFDGSPQLAWKFPDSYVEAKRAGDYHDFDYDPDLPGEDELMMPETGPAEPTPGADEQQGLGPLQLVHTAVTKDGDLEQTLKSAEKAETLSKEEQMAAAVSSDEEFVPPPMVEEDEIYGIELAVKPKKPSPKTKKKKPELKPEDGGIQKEEEDEEKAEPSKGKASVALAFVVKLLTSALDFVAAFFNRRSRDHRYVSWVLNKEKVLLKQKMLEDDNVHRRSLRELRRDVIDGELGNQIRCVNTQADIAAMEKQLDDYWNKYNCVVRFGVALGYLLLSRTELLCYLMLISDHMRTAAVISLPLPLLAFFWGTLCSPRPPKFFWIVVIAYTEAVVVVKFIFQFAIFSWNNSPVDDKNPFWAPRILGIEKQRDFASLDVALLIVLFFHRYMLRKLGLWKDAKSTASLVGIVEEQDEQPERTTGILIEDKKRKNSFELQDLSPPETSKTCEPDADLQPLSEEENEEKKKVPSRSLAYCGSFLNFYHRLLNPTFRYIQDLYPFMFLCDIFCLIICVFGYQYFGVPTGSGNVLADVTSNRVPLPFVIILMTLTFLMIIDRALYLRKTTVGRLVFQYLLVVGIHAYIFFGLPAVTERSTRLNKVVQFWYFVKCVYLLFSAWQIKNGYPSQILGNLLTRSYGLVSFVSFKVFMLVPFLFELRTVIDWIWTDTSMPLFDFFNMESFYAVIYSLKCGRKLEQDYPAPRGQPKGAVVKYAMGGGLMIVIYGIIWLPLLIYALLNLIGERNLPAQVTFTVSVEGYPPLYTMDATTIYVAPMDKFGYDDLKEKFQNNKSVLNFLQDYGYLDTLKVELRPDSLTNWEISDPSKKALIADMENSTQEMYLMVHWKFQRPRVKETSEPVVHTDSRSMKLVPRGELREKFLNILRGTSTSVDIKDLFPPYIIIPASGKTQLATELLYVMGGAKKDVPVYSKAFADVTMTMESGQSGSVKYWTAKTNLALPGSEEKNKYITASGEDGGMVIVAFVDKVFPEALSSFVSTGIIAMYLAIVLLVSRVLRGIVVNEPLSLVISEMPFVDRLLSICLNVYLVREAKDFALEQDLYAKLVFLFRSPETLIKWTRPKPKTD